MNVKNLKLKIESQNAYIAQEANLIKMIEKAIESPDYDRFPLSPSQALKCSRMLWYSLKNQEEPVKYPKSPYNARTLLTFAAGNQAEWSLIKYLRKAKDFDVVYEQKTMEIFSANAFKIQGTCDLILNVKGTLILVDIKSINQEGFKNSDLPKLEHYAQVQLYLNSRFAKENNIKYGGILYFNKNMCQLKMKMFEREQECANKLIERFQCIYSKYQFNELPQRDFLLGHKETEGYSQCGYCPFRKKCYENILDWKDLQPENFQPIEITDKKDIDFLLEHSYNEATEREAIEKILELSPNGQIILKTNENKQLLLIVYQTKSKINLRLYVPKGGINES